MSTLRRLLAAAAAVAIWATFQPHTVSAQTSGVGGDASTVFRWIARDSGNQPDMLSLWKVDGNLNYITSQQYGPYSGYYPDFITTNKNGYTYVLWEDYTPINYMFGNYLGAQLWLVDPNLNYVTSVEYGPYAGWTPEGLSVDTDGSNYIRLIWKNDDGSISVWVLDQNLNYSNSATFGPVSGWDPGDNGP
jgi:hypothetical protein